MPSNNRVQPNPRYKSVSDLYPTAREHYEVARQLGTNFTASSFKAHYKRVYPERAHGSMLPSDYAYNRDNKGNRRHPRFLQWEGGRKYSFVGLGTVNEEAEGQSASTEPPSAASVDGELPASHLHSVTAEHIQRAVQRLLEGNAHHEFKPSTDYDLIADEGTRLPPKAVFGIAASEALGFQVLPHHFRGGISTPCFRALEAAGYRIVSKNEAAMSEAVPPEPDDLVWAEGRPRLVQHLVRERKPGLAAAKKAQFIREEGRLFCERCGLDPVEHFGGDHGTACIEVHHHATAVADMVKGHGTRLEDLRCLCANCHRVVHRLLRDSERENS